jgi:hypothetical protein
METITRMNYGQHLLFSYLCISIEGRTEKDLKPSQLEDLINDVIELTSEDNQDTIYDCADYQVMVNPEDSYKIFCEFWDENQTYWLSYL